MSSLKFDYTAAERFLRYVTIDTQSDPDSATTPSTEKQKDLGRLLAAELREIGLSDAEMDAYGYVYATLPANSAKAVPVICLCSHMDTSPDAPGAGVKPQVVKNYQGGDIALPGDPAQVIRFADHPALESQIGNDIITSDGTTLLGADNKAGLAEIVDAMRFLVQHPEIKHGTIKVLFTPDEEIGRGVDKVDLARLGADFAYTIDGEAAGNVEDETFSADAATVTVQGVTAHPGFAKGRMENAVKIAARIIALLPKDTCSPETTEGREGFVHPLSVEAEMDKATLKFILRDFTEAGLKDKARVLEDAVKAALARLPALHLQARDQGAVPQHEGGARPPPRGRRQRPGGGAPRRADAGEGADPRRHRRLAAVVHGAALPQYLRRRACLPLAAGMGERSGHAGRRAHHRAPGHAVGRAGVSGLPGRGLLSRLRLPWPPKTRDNARPQFASSPPDRARPGDPPIPPLESRACPT